MDTNVKEIDKSKEYETPFGVPPWHSNESECLYRIYDVLLGKDWHLVGHVRLNEARELAASRVLKRYNELARGAAFYACCTAALSFALVCAMGVIIYLIQR